MATDGAQLDMITDVFNRLVESCHAKCISPRYAEADLNKGESVCVDGKELAHAAARSASLYIPINAKVGEQMQALGQAASAAGGRMMG